MTELTVPFSFECMDLSSVGADCIVYKECTMADGSQYERITFSCYGNECLYYLETSDGKNLGKLVLNTYISKGKPVYRWTKIVNRVTQDDSMKRSWWQQSNQPHPPPCDPYLAEKRRNDIRLQSKPPVVAQGPQKSPHMVKSVAYGPG